MAGLAALAGASMQTLPAGEPQSAELLSGGRDRVVQYSVSPPSRRERRALADLDSLVLAPALERLRARELTSIDLLIDRVHARVTRSGLARFWRRQRPWWEYLRR